MPKDFTRVNVTSYTPMTTEWGTGPTTWYAIVEEWRAYVTESRWEWVYTIATGDSEAEVRNKAAALLREWAGELEAPPKKPARPRGKKMTLDMPRGWNRYNANEGD